MAATDLMTEDLANLLQNLPENTLVVDCRPFLAYNSGHISSAHNIHCPPIVKRRSGGSLPIENIVRCETTRSRLLCGEYQNVIVYDEDTSCLQQLADDSNMLMVLKSLNELNLSVCYLKGGFQNFLSVCPFLCVSHTSTESESSESTQAMEWCTPSYIPPLEEAPKVKSAGPRDTVKYRPSQDQGDPEAILPWLFLGSAYHAMQEPNLLNVGINALLNMASKSDTLTPAPKFLHKRMAVDDSCTSDISSWFPEAIDFIESVRKEGGKVLVHCHAGISRSATVCIAYIMWYKHWTMERAYDYLKSKRSLIAPNLNFMRQLLEFENQLEQSGRGGRLSSTSTHSSSSSYMSAISGLSAGCECDTNGIDSNKPCQYCSAVLSSNLSSPRHFDFDSTAISMSTSKSPRFSAFDNFNNQSLSTNPRFSSSQKLIQGISSSSLSTANNSSDFTGGGNGAMSLNKTSSFNPFSPSPLSTNAITLIQPPRSASANLFSSSVRTNSPVFGGVSGGLGGIIEATPRPGSAKPVFNLPLTPCTQQANVFSFDSPICSPLSQHTNSPTLTLCHSPLVSPS